VGAPKQTVTTETGPDDISETTEPEHTTETLVEDPPQYEFTPEQEQQFVRIETAMGYVRLLCGFLPFDCLERNVLINGLLVASPARCSMLNRLMADDADLL
jgi:hypothetical protein